MTKHAHITLVLLLIACGGGCADLDRAPRASADDGTSSDGGSETAAPVEIDLEMVLAVSKAYAELEPLTEVHDLAETHADAAAVRVWGTPDARAPFDSIDPDDPTLAAMFPEDTFLVKEHFDADGDMFGINVMYKAPAGYNPAANDWHWLEVRSDEITHSGRDGFCLDCHAAAINSDFVVGFGKSQ